MDECRKELRLESKDVKANAIMKLTYVISFLFYFSLLQLQMMGYDISWAAFNVGCLVFPISPRQMIEVMSSKKFSHKVQVAPCKIYF